MFTNRDTAKDYGNRLREYRNMLGWSQKTLAEKAMISPQSISKYEKEGIHDIEAIHRLSEILGHDLLTEDRDQEGTIGEIGQEILAILIESRGVVHASYLLDGQQLYGLSSDEVLHELMKLKNIGMIVREQYTDFDGKEYDLVFITAKGIIGYKHLTGRLLETSSFKSFEQYCGGNACYQDLVDANLAQSKINQLDEVGSYRYHLIRFIRNSYQIRTLGSISKGMRSRSGNESWFGVDFPRALDTIPPKGIPGSAAHDTAYQMIIQSMIRKVTKEKLDWHYGPYYNYEDTCNMEGEWLAELEEEEAILTYDLNGDDSEEKSLLLALSDTMGVPFDWFDNVFYPGRQGEILKKYSPEEYDAIQKRLAKIEETKVSVGDDYGYTAYAEEKEGFLPELHDDQEIFEYWTELKGDPCPLNWFSKEEIEAFIKENIVPAVSEEEKKIEEDIQFILSARPDVAANYFKFPLEWKLNGLADLVLEVFNVKHIFVESK